MEEGWVDPTQSNSGSECLGSVTWTTNSDPLSSTNQRTPYTPYSLGGTYALPKYVLNIIALVLYTVSFSLLAVIRDNVYMPLDMEHHNGFPAKVVSIILGWAYFLAWSASFYPQPLLNYRRKSTTGLAIDYPTLNVLGFASYTISTTAFLFSATIRAQYAARHPEDPVSTVRFNDFAFALHGLVLVLITYSQFFPKIWGFEVSKLQRMSTVVRIIVVGSLAAIVAAIGWAAYLNLTPGAHTPFQWDWIDVIYLFSHIKLVATFVKYTPQVWVNYKRKSTEGWSIAQILCDLLGSIFSLSQLFIDASFNSDWSGITGNPIKFGLANVSMVFDIIFILQHYVIYTQRSALATANMDDSEDVRQPLLSGD